MRACANCGSPIVGRRTDALYCTAPAASPIAPRFEMNNSKPHLRGRPPMPDSERADSQIQLRVTRKRKAAYVRAANGKTLAAWCFENLDRASGYAK